MNAQLLLHPGGWDEAHIGDPSKRVAHDSATVVAEAVGVCMGKMNPPPDQRFLFISNELS